VLVVQTDNGAEFQAQFHWHLEERDIRHVYIRPHTPRLKGKVERSHRVDDQEFYQLLDTDGITDDIHLFNDKLREWEDYYNYHRPHGALAGQTPYERLLAKTRADVSPKLRLTAKCRPPFLLVLRWSYLIPSEPCSLVFGTRLFTDCSLSPDVNNGVNDKPGSWSGVRMDFAEHNGGRV
jgi:hypothetical protein